MARKPADIAEPATIEPATVQSVPVTVTEQPAPIYPSLSTEDRLALWRRADVIYTYARRADPDAVLYRLRELVEDLKSDTPLSDVPGSV